MHQFLCRTTETQKPNRHFKVHRLSLALSGRNQYRCSRTGSVGHMFYPRYPETTYKKLIITCTDVVEDKLGICLGFFLCSEWVQVGFCTESPLLFLFFREFFMFFGILTSRYDTE